MNDHKLNEWLSQNKFDISEPLHINQTITNATTLIRAGAALDTQNVNGATALIYCASAGKTPLVRLLLDAGADTELMTLDDFTALELAANRECMKMLKQAKVTAHV